MDFEKLDVQRGLLAQSPELWQFDLLNPQKICQFAKDRRVLIFDDRTVAALWHIGLLRADLVRVDGRLDMPGLELVSDEGGIFVYCDKRPVTRRAEGYGGTLQGRKEEVGTRELLFHPFRLYVLYHIERVFPTHIASTQFLLDPLGLVRLTQGHIDFLEKWTAGEEFANVFERWNRTAEIAIALEPSAYGAVFHSIRWRSPDTAEIVEAKQAKYKETVKNFLSSVAVKEINEIRGALCRDAEILDRNKLVHVLLRLMSRHERLKLRDALGCSMQFLCMAEIIRRAAEDALGETIPEEDEMGFGQWMDGARKSIYGSERILDATRETQRDFLTTMGLDYGIKVRCYVEGETEYGALTSAVGEAGGTEFVNLRGQVIERRGKGLSFIGSLQNDRKSHVFSVVVLDQDRTDYIRAMKKAAADETFFGRFFISSPDFEFHNFTVEELADAALGLAAQNGNQVPERSAVLTSVAGAKSGRQFIEALKKCGISDVGKSESWGVALMNHAVQHPQFPPNDPRAGTDRPVIVIARLLVVARESGYLRSLDRYRVNPDTGELQER